MPENPTSSQISTIAIKFDWIKGFATMTKARIAIFATGGTIVSSGDSATQMTGYSIKGLNVNDLIGAVPQLADVADIEARQIANIDSSSMTAAVWTDLARAIDEETRREDVTGVVVTHGTDTLEETAYFLNLLLKTEKPVVLTGAMRPATALSAEGPLNLLNAVRVAAEPAARGKGVLIVLNDAIGTARDMTKTHPTNVATFRGPDLGAIGAVSGDRIEFIGASAKDHTARTPFSVEKLDQYLKENGKLPRVDIVYSHTDDDGVMVKAALAAGARGIVHAGTGNGSIHEATEPALFEAAKSGVVVVRASRVHGGATVEGLASWQEAGFVPAGSLNPQKARVLLQLALTQTKDAAEIDALFRRL